MFKQKIEGSIDIGSSSIKGLTLKKGKIEKFVIENLPHGSIISGNIEDHMSVRDAIGSVVKSLGLKNKEVIVSLPIQNFFVKFINIMNVDEKEKIAVIESELEELVPSFDPDEYITQYVSLLSYEENEDIMAITIQEEKINDIIEILTSLKVKPIQIIPDFISLYNLLQISKENIIDNTDGASIMVVDIGAEATKIFIEKDGLIKMQRIAAIGGNDFTDVIERNQHLGYEEAEKEKQRLELKDGNEETFEDEFMNEVGELVEELTSQIRRSIDYYRNQEGIMGIDGLVITGGTSNLKGYREVLENSVMTEAKNFPISYFFEKNEETQEMIERFSKSFDVLIGNVINEVVS